MLGKKLTCFLASAALALTLAATDFKITADAEMPVFRCGEKASFTVSATENGKPVSRGTCTVTFTLGGTGKKLSVETVDFSKANPAKVEATLTEPGFLLAAVRHSEIKKLDRKHLAGAGFEPEKIRSGWDLPEDFTQFWEEGRAAIAKYPVQLEEIKEKSTDAVTAYRVTVKVLHGENLYGFLAVPKGKGVYPAHVMVPGAGPGAVAPDVNLASRGVITLTMNVHKYRALENAAEQRKLYAEKQTERGHTYSVDQSDNRDKYHFRNVILGVDRAINHVVSMPQWDKKHFVINGSSQGGGMAIIMAGFNQNLTAAAGNVPAICDHGGFRFGRQAGWPQLHRNNPASDPVSPYYDAANFARFVKVPVLVSCGFIDTVCSPESVHAMYNNLATADKRIINMPLAVHETPKIYSDARNAFVNKHLGF